MARGSSAVGNHASWRWLAAFALLPALTVLSAPRRANALRAKNTVPQTVFLPVQSNAAKDLGAAPLLVASRDLADPNFVKTVILVVHHDDESVVGLILNRRTEVPLSRVFDGLEAAKGLADPVFLGGPVDRSAVFAVLQSPVKVEGAEHVFGDIYLIVAKAPLEHTIAARPDPSDFHVYLGYAGWTHEQLRREVELGAWSILQADSETVFDSHPDTLWSRMITKTEHRLVGLY
jgi:putative transcriptional regulator